MNKLPSARNKNIIVQTLGKEVLIYDLNSHQAYNLNETLSLVYHACDGETTFDQLRSKSKLPDDIVFLALDELQQAKLLEENEQYKSPYTGLTRREIIRRIGFASVIALPIISTLVAPLAVNAQSRCPSISPCNGNPSIPRGCPCTLNCSNCRGGVCDTTRGVCT